MMEKLRRLILCFLLCAAMLTLPQAAFCDGEEFGNLPGGGCDPVDPSCPIDGGLVALLAVGVGYGIKKVRDANRNSEEPESS